MRKISCPAWPLCIAITGGGGVLQAAEVHAVGQPYLEALVLAILLGVGDPQRRGRPGRALMPGI